MRLKAMEERSRMVKGSVTVPHEAAEAAEVRNIFTFLLPFPFSVGLIICFLI